MALYIYTPNETLKTLLKTQIQNHRWTDSGFDIPIVAQNVDLSKRVNCFPLAVHVAATFKNGEPAPCLLLARSSIYKTQFRLCNSIGLVDAGYRGEVKAMVDNTVPEDESTMRFEDGTRLFQICQHNFLPWESIVLVDSLTDLPSANDTRGGGGFGSTGLQVEQHPRT